LLEIFYEENLFYNKLEKNIWNKKNNHARYIKTRFWRCCDCSKYYYYTTFFFRSRKEKKIKYV